MNEKQMEILSGAYAETDFQWPFEKGIMPEQEACFVECSQEFSPNASHSQACGASIAMLNEKGIIQRGIQGREKIMQTLSALERG